MTVTATSPHEYDLDIQNCVLILPGKNFTMVENGVITPTGVAFDGTMLSNDSFEFRRFSLSVNPVDPIDVHCDVNFRSR